MLTENAVVIAYQEGVAQVECQSQSACGSCAAKRACGSAALSELTGHTQQHILSVQSITPLKVGQVVEIGLPETSLIMSVILAYLIPLVTLLITTFVSEQFFTSELLRAAFIALFTALAFIGVRIYSQKLNKKSAYQPILLRVLH